MFGTFAGRVFERSTDELPLLDRSTVRRATGEDLAHLAGLLAPGVDHAARLAAGDVCLWFDTPDGRPAGLQWVNLALHTDQYLGRWSRPDPDLAYTNQTLAAPA